MLKKRINRKTSVGYKNVRREAVLYAVQLTNSKRIERSFLIEVMDLFNNHIGYTDADVVSRDIYDRTIIHLQKQIMLGDGDVDKYVALEDLMLCKEITEEEMLDIALLINEVFKKK